jgi:hypothetical protein
MSDDPVVQLAFQKARAKAIGARAHRRLAELGGEKASHRSKGNDAEFTRRLLRIWNQRPRNRSCGTSTVRLPQGGVLVYDHRLGKVVNDTSPYARKEMK